MTIYETIKVAISVKQAAEHYGLKVNRNGMACCPFHNDRHPSMKLNEDYFFCFGCGVKGDVIDFVARSFDLSSYEAAQKLASDFGLDPKPPTSAAMLKPFVEACQMIDYIEYLADILTVGDLEERVAVVDELMKESKIAFLRNYVARKRKEGLSHGEER